MVRTSEFEDLITEAEAAPVDGWGFAWLDGRATEERPTWGYSRMAVARIQRARSLLDVQTGGAEVLAEILDNSGHVPTRVVATESWAPNVRIASANLRDRNGNVVRIADDGPFPFRDGTFDLVVSRHPVVTRWDEVGRVLFSGGTYFAQHIGAGSNRELIDFMMGPQPVSRARSTERAVTEADAHGLELVDLREESLRVEFHDVGAVAYFLRKVIWTVPDFTVERYRGRLADMHERITTDGVFVCYSRRFLIELRKS